MRVCTMVLAAVVTLVAGNTFAQDDDEGLKIAILDMGAALLNSEVAQGVEAELQTETADDRDKIKTLAEQAQKLQDQLQQDSEVMSESEQRRIVGELQELQNQYQFLVQKLQKLSQDRRQQFQQKYSPNLVQAISDVIEEGGYDLVIRAEAAPYFDASFDITARVTEKLNQQNL